MANPTAIDDIIRFRATIEPGGGIAQQSFSEPVFVSTFDDSVDFPDRVEQYTGQLSDMQAALIADGFSANDPAYRQITVAKLQQDAPETIYIGRADPADADYAASLTAIWDEAEAKEFSLYFLAVDERSPSQIEAISDWVAQRTFVFYMAQTASNAVYTNQPGNVAANILAKTRDTTALFWHDPVVATNYGPATLTSLRGPFVLSSESGDIQVRIDGGGLQTFTLTATYTEDLGSNTETFSIANGDAFAVTVDNGLLQTLVASLLPASVTSNDGNFNIPPNSSLSTAFNGGVPLVASFPGTAGSVATSNEPYAFLLGDSVTFDIDGAGPQVINFDVTDTTRALVKAKLDALTGATVVDTGAALIITSNTTGSASDVEITAGSANALAELGLAVGNNAGSGSFPNFADVTPAQLQGVLAAAYAASANVTVDGSAVKIETLQIGKAAAVRVLDSLANDAIGFSTSEVRGDGFANDGSAVQASEVVTWFEDNLAGLSFFNEAGAVKLRTRSRGAASTINVQAGPIQAVLGLTAGPVINAGSNVQNAASVSASEISSVISGTIVDGQTSAAKAQFSIASNTVGGSSSVELVGETYATLFFGTQSTTALGTGTDEDYLDCAALGWGSTFKLDTSTTAGGGQSTWDNMPLVGVLPDSIDKQTRTMLHNTLRVNTFERRQQRNETHFGTVLFNQGGTYRYIDQRVTLDWGWARSVETMKRTLNRVADVKAKLGLSNGGIQTLATDWIRQLRAGEDNGHWIYDDSTITGPLDTGITIPTRQQQSITNVNLRKVAGFAARFRFQDAIQRADGDLRLTSTAVEFNVDVAA